VPDQDLGNRHRMVDVGVSVAASPQLARVGSPRCFQRVSD